MKYENDEYHERYARALKGTQNLAALACYRLVMEPVIMPPALQEGLNVSAENLVFLPSGGDHPCRLMEAVRETRSNVLIVEPGETTQGNPTFYFTLLLCAGGKIHRHSALRLWVDLDRRLFLIPDPDGGEPEGACFRIYKGVRPADRPWAHEIERDFGLRHADALLLAP